MGLSGNPAKRAAQQLDGPQRRAILWASNSPFATSGYGTQTAQAITRLARDGHRIAVACNWGVEDTSGLSWNGIPLLPKGYESHSQDVVEAYFHYWADRNPGLAPLLVTLYDVWIYNHKQWDSIPQIASWVPVDRAPVPPLVAEFCRRPNVTPLAMSRFGEAKLAEAGIESIYIPHGIDTSVFKPTGFVLDRDGNPVTGRQLMRVPDDAFVVGMVSMNKGRLPNRKSFGEAFMAFGMFARQYPDAVLYVHTEATGAMVGIDLRELAGACHIPPDQIVFVDEFTRRMGVAQETMAAIYSGMDVLLIPSMGEGFGIPLVEAQSCGTRAIASNFSAQPELLGDGWLVDGQPFWDPDQRSFLWTPYIPSIVEGLMAAYEVRGQESAKAIDFVRQYDADYVFDAHWRPAMELLAP